MKNYLVISMVVLALVVASPATILAQTSISTGSNLQAKVSFIRQVEHFIDNVFKFVLDLRSKSVVEVTNGGSGAPAPATPEVPAAAMVALVTGPAVDSVLDQPSEVPVQGEDVVLYCKGDTNHDGVVNNFDIDSFNAALHFSNGGDSYALNFPQSWYADVVGGKDNVGDQILDESDSDVFLDMLLNHPALRCVTELPDAPKTPVAGGPVLFCKGDMNHDGRVNNFDIDRFMSDIWSQPDRSDYWANFSQSWYADIDNSLTITDEDNAMFRHLVIDQAIPECVETLPEQPIAQCPLMGDMNHDGVVNNFDIDPFVEYLNGKHEVGQPDFAAADFDHDGGLTNADADLFTNVILGYATATCVGER
jgi:hypothetical protein